MPSPQRSKLWRVVAVVLAMALAAAWLAWYLLTPEDLPVSEQEVMATGVAGTPVYVGMYRVPEDADRTIHVSGVKLHTTANTEVEVEPLLCRGGAIGNTTEPEVFCEDLVDPAGEELGPGDSIVIEVTADQAAVAVVDRIRIGFREGVVSGTKPAGVARAIVHIAGQEGGAPEAE